MRLISLRIPVSELLQDYKYSHQLDFADDVPKLLTQHLFKQALPDLIIPMPLQKRPKQRAHLM
jgi:predicted amidophosphoribosyltransferase